MTSRRKPAEPGALARLVATARQLNAPGGCPWDRAQTIDSLLPHLIEEVWEVFYARQRRWRRAFEEELGDVLYTVIFLTVLSEREGWSGLETIATRAQRKMHRRHPHVFGGASAHTPEAAYRQWQQAKRREGAKPSLSKQIRPLLVEVFARLSRGPVSINALTRALQPLRQRMWSAGTTTNRVRRATVRPRRSSGTQARDTNRSSDRARRPRGVD